MSFKLCPYIYLNLKSSSKMLLTYVNATGYFDLASGSKEFAFTAKLFNMNM